MNANQSTSGLRPSSEIRSEALKRAATIEGAAASADGMFDYPRVLAGARLFEKYLRGEDALEHESPAEPEAER